MPTLEELRRRFAASVATPAAKEEAGVYVWFTLDEVEACQNHFELCTQDDLGSPRIRVTDAIVLRGGLSGRRFSDIAKDSGWRDWLRHLYQSVHRRVPGGKAASLKRLIGQVLQENHDEILARYEASSQGE